MPDIPEYSNHNGHMFFLVCNNGKERIDLITHLRKNKIESTFHYLSLHKSDYFKDVYIGDSLPNSDRFTDCIVRLPLHPQLKLSKQNKVIDKIISYY